jgi:site-specific recombinase XerD
MARKRTFNATIPAHIEQEALPKGLYWDNQRWYMLLPHPEGGRPVKKTVAYANARMSELHAIVEAKHTGLGVGTLAHLVALFRGPDPKDPFKGAVEWLELSKGTRDDYNHHADMACNYVLQDGTTLGQFQVERMTVPMIQRLVEALAKGWPASPRRPAAAARPSTANHVLRFLRRLFAWGIRHGHCKFNPADGVRQAREAGEFHMPDPHAFRAVFKFARERASLPLHSKGAVPPYMPAVMMLAYKGRLRGIEVTDLTDANCLQDGLLCIRRKGSLDSITPWSRELRWAWAWLRRYRSQRMEAHRRPVALQADRRPLLVTQSGTPLARSSLKTSWQRMILAAISEGVITEDLRFNLHGLKHRGITDTPGTRDVKRDGAGHVNPAMTVRYDHSVPVVASPTLPATKRPRR